MSKTHWKKLTNPNYLGTYALPDGQDMILTIGTVAQEPVTGADGQKETCIVCHWKEDGVKPLILNKTNCKTISKILKTPIIEEWAGHRVQIGAEMVSAFGERVDAIRVRPKLPEDVSIPCEVCGQMIAPAHGMSVKEMAAYTKKRFGKQMCSECGRDAANKEKEGKANADSDT